MGTLGVLLWVTSAAAAAPMPPPPPATPVMAPSWSDAEAKSIERGFARIREQLGGMGWEQPRGPWISAPAQEPVRGPALDAETLAKVSESFAPFVARDPRMSSMVDFGWPGPQPPPETPENSLRGLTPNEEILSEWGEDDRRRELAMSGLANPGPESVVGEATLLGQMLRSAQEDDTLFSRVHKRIRLRAQKL